MERYTSASMIAKLYEMAGLEVFPLRRFEEIKPQEIIKSENFEVIYEWSRPKK